MMVSSRRVPSVNRWPYSSSKRSLSSNGSRHSGQLDSPRSCSSCQMRSARSSSSADRTCTRPRGIADEEEVFLAAGAQDCGSRVMLQLVHEGVEAEAIFAAEIVDDKAYACARRANGLHQTHDCRYVIVGEPAYAVPPSAMADSRTPSARLAPICRRPTGRPRARQRVCLARPRVR
jgi:hypothetical protein